MSPDRFSRSSEGLSTVRYTVDNDQSDVSAISIAGSGLPPSVTAFRMSIRLNAVLYLY